MTASLSAAERAWLSQGIEQNIRADGRAWLDYRTVSIETGILSQTNGSARVRVANTDVLVGVKVEIGNPLEDRPDQGRLAFSVECHATATASYLGRASEHLSHELSRSVERLCSIPGTLDMGALCISPNQTCWIVYIDAIVLDAGGNLLDVVVLGVRAALFNTRVPKVELVPGDKPGEMDLEVNDDPHESSRISVERFPTCVTLCKVGGRFIVDPTAEEEECASAKLSAAVDKNGNVCGTVKSGHGALDVSSLEQMQQSARKVGGALCRAIDDSLLREESLAGAPHSGFLL